MLAGNHWWLLMGVMALFVMACQSSGSVSGTPCVGADCPENRVEGPGPLNEANPYFGGGETPESSDVEQQSFEEGGNAEEGGGGGAVASGTAGSCVGSCGVEWVEDCSCAQLCVNAGVCCTDYCGACGCEEEEEESGGEDPGEEEGGGELSSSCQGQCGGVAPSGCLCSDVCEAFGTCCADACEECGVCGGSGNTGGGSGDFNGCTGNCGTQAPSGCFCDNGCASFGDCCDDACEVCGACPGANDGANGFPARLLVVTANVENLPTAEKSPFYCSGDWEDLYYYLGAQSQTPDLILFQQISDQAQLDYLADELNAFTGQLYGGVIANPNPENWGAADCDYKKKQTNGMLYRLNRLSLVEGSEKTFFSYEDVGDGACELSTLSRYENIVAEFTDNVGGGKRVVAASVHWPPGQATCEADNAQALDQGFQGYDQGKMQVVGADISQPDLVIQEESSDYSPWYAAMNGELNAPGNLGFRDAVYRYCAQTSGQGIVNKNCLIYSWTLYANQFEDRRRMHYLFTRYANGYGLGVGLPPVSGVTTITFEDAGAAQGSDDDPLPYSKSRAIRGFLHW